MSSSRSHTFDGMSLCSQRDPVREASQWCDHVLKNEPAISTQNQYWVLGLGAGYHIEELAKRRPKSVICVIEFRTELVSSFLNWGKNLQGQVMVTEINEAVDIFKTKQFEIFGFELSPVFKFMPSLQGYEKIATQTENHLLGRSPEGFALFSKQFGFHFSEQRLVGAEHINIKVVDSLFDGMSGTTEKRIVSFLRELVR